ncbi:Panacea domain-containing protein [Chloroflexota bacterium]
MNTYRNKLLNAVLFFAKNTQRPNLTKVLKLLYFLDFTHFKQTGYPSIGLEYYAWERGPVPKEFWIEVKDGIIPDDFEGKLAILPIEQEDPLESRKELLFKAIAKPDLTVFSPREIKTLEYLADVYRDTPAYLMSEATHLYKQPWNTTKKTKGLNNPIDYLLCIDEETDMNLDEAKETLKEHFAMVHNFGIEPTK